MQFQTLLASASLVLLTLLSGGSSPDERGAFSAAGPAILPESSYLSQLRDRGNKALSEGQYLEAVQIYTRGYQEALQQNQSHSALRFLNNLGGANYKMFRYRDAIEAFLKARDLARAEKDQEVLAALSANLASLYYTNGETNSAAEAAAEGLKLPRSAGARFRSKLLIDAALVREREGQWPEAFALLKQARASAQKDKDVATEGQALSELGRALLLAGKLPEAGKALESALLIREKRGGESLHYLYEYIAELRLRQGDISSAIANYDRAVTAAARFGPAAKWTPLYLRGHALLSAGKEEEAYRSFQASLDAARESRRGALPADAFRVSSDVSLHEVYAAFVDTGAKLYRETGRSRFLKETFAMEEEDRAASLRALWAGGDLSRTLEPEYWQALSELESAEVGSIRNLPGADAELRHAQARLTEMELKAGLDLPAPNESDDPHGNEMVRAAQNALGEDEVYFAFHLDQQRPCVWVVTREGIQLYDLATSFHFGQTVTSFRKALLDSSADFERQGALLYAAMFDKVGERALGKPVWIIAPDDALFDLPFAALVTTGATGGHFLVEEHALNLVPGISALRTSAHFSQSGPFVAVGDPVYNHLDSRLLAGQASARGGKGSPSAEVKYGQRMELNRLPGTGREVESCAQLWRAHGSETRVLEGRDASKAELASALSEEPQVIHIAAHVLAPPRDPGATAVALSLLPDDRVQLLSPPEIATMRCHAGLLVLDGCGSGRGEILPGAGLMGMTRAWIGAGAGAVIATRWLIDDREAGNFFRDFYELYFEDRDRRRRKISRILQKTQLRQLRSSGTHRSPAYWAGYFAVDRN